MIFSILKNAISGLYVVNPPFWDKVDDLKKDVVDGATGLVNDTIGKSNNVAAKKLGGALTLILGYIPNIKALTDFDDSDGEYVDKKQYFIKSIPLLVAQIFICVLIFMGYPTKIASWIGDGGTYIIDSVINNVDPVETVKKVSDSIFVYSLASDGTQDPYEENVNLFTRTMMRVVTTQYDDMKKDSVQNTALVLENLIDTAFNDDTIRDVLGVAEGYDISCSAIHQTAVPTQSSAFDEINPGLFASTATNGAVTYRYFINGADLNTGSPKESSADWFVLAVNAVPVSVSNSSNAGLIIIGGYTNQAVQEGTDSSAKIKIPVTGITVGTNATGSDVKGTLGKLVTVDAVTDGTVTETFQATLQSPSVAMTMGAPVQLTFGISDKERLKSAMDSSSYLRVNLTGNWTKDIVSGTTTTTLRVIQWRLTPNGGDTLQYALSTWPDFTDKDVEGTTDLAGILKKSSKSGE